MFAILVVRPDDTPEISAFIATFVTFKTKLQVTKCTCFWLFLMHQNYPELVVCDARCDCVFLKQHSDM